MAKFRTDLTFQAAAKLLDCDPVTGVVKWRRRTPDMFSRTARSSAERICKWWNTTYAGKVAGSPHRGYCSLRINNVAYLRHRIVWLLTYGAWPDAGLDHRNGKEAGDGVQNLRNATQSQNMGNSHRRSDNKSGFKGVSWDSINTKWVARIRVPRGSYKNLGRYDSALAAHEAYCLAAQEIYGEFARAA